MISTPRIEMPNSGAISLEDRFILKNGFNVCIFIQGTQGNDIYNDIFRYDFFYSNRPNSQIQASNGAVTQNQVYKSILK